MASDNLPPGVPLEKVPGLKPPPGVTPNFVNPENYQSSILALQTICLVLATVFTALKIYTKLFLIKSLGSEDYFSCFAWVGFVAYTALAISTLQYGNGVHQWDVPLSNVLQFGKLASIVEILYCPIIFSAKVAILLQISRIFVINRKTIRFYLIQILIWTNAIWYIINIFILAFQCTPIAKVWNPTLPGHCFISFYQVNFIAAVFNVVSDILILVLPVLWVLQLQMPRSRKVGVALIFASGLFCCISSIMRLAFFLRWGKSPDTTWYLTYDGNWTLAEITSAIICGCLPAIPRAMAQFKSRISDIASSYLHLLPRTKKPANSQAYALEQVALKKSPALRSQQDNYLKLGDNSERQTDQPLWKPDDATCHPEPDSMSSFSPL